MSSRLAAAVVVASALSGCAGSRRESGEPPRAKSASADGGLAAARDAGPPEVPVPPAVALGVRGLRVAPGMRELARLDPAPARSPDLLQQATADTCVRAVWAASRPVRVGFVDREGEPRGERAEGTEGTVPPGGPVCSVRGEALHLVVEGAPPGATARAVVWASP